MVKKWTDVAGNPEFQALPDDEKDVVREAYFERVVAPEVAPAELEATRERFNRAAGFRRRELPAGTAPSAAGAGRGTVAPPLAGSEPGTAAPAPASAAPAQPAEGPGAALANVRENEAAREARLGPRRPMFSRGSVLDTPYKGPMPQPAPLTDAELQENVRLSRAPQVLEAEARAARAPDLKPADSFVAPTGGPIEALRAAPGMAARALGASAMRAGALLADYGLGVPGGPTPSQFRLEQQRLERGNRTASMGLSDEALVKLGPVLTALVPSSRTLGEGLSEVGKQITLNTVLPGGIITDAGLAGVDEGQMAGMSPGSALLFGAMKALTEGVPEQVSARFNLKAGAEIPVRALLTDPQVMVKAAKRFGAGMGVELTTEQASAIGNWVVDRATNDQTATLDRLGTDMTDAVKATLIQAPGMMAAGKIIAGAGKAGRKISEFDIAAVRGFHVKPPLATDAPDAQVGKRVAAFKALAAEAGLPSSAVKRATEALDGMPAEKVGPFLAALMDAYQQNGVSAKVVDPLLTGLLVAPPVEPAQDLAEGETKAPSSETNAAERATEAPAGATAAQAAEPPAPAAAQAVAEIERLLGTKPSNAVITADTAAVVTGAQPLASPIDVAAHEAATSPTNDLAEPTDPQKDAGNTKMGHLRLGGLDLSIENPQGSVRRAKQDAPVQWQSVMNHHYGYIRGTVGLDGDHIDAFVKPGTPEEHAGEVFVIDQQGPDGKPDEHKVMIGFASAEEAQQAYLSNYQKGWKGLRAITAAPLEQFKAWLRDGDTTQPFNPEAYREPAQPDVQPAPAPAAPAPAGRGAEPAGGGRAVGLEPAAPAPAPGGTARPPGDGRVAPVAVPDAGEGSAAVGPRVAARVGITPKGAVPLELRPNADGSLGLWLEGHEVLDYNTGDPVSVPAGSTDAEAIQALKDSGALGRRHKVYSATAKEKPDAERPADKNAPAPEPAPRTEPAEPGAAAPAPAAVEAPAAPREPETVEQPATLAEALDVLMRGDRIVRAKGTEFEETTWLAEERPKSRAPTWVVKRKAGNSTATIGPAGPDRSFGWGRIDAARRATQGWDFAAAQAPRSPLVQAMNDLADVRGRIEQQGRVVDDRLLQRERQLRQIVAELEAEGSKPAAPATPERVFDQDFAALEGRVLEQQVRVAETGQTVTLRMDAAKALRDLTRRRKALLELRDCIGRNA